MTRTTIHTRALLATVCITIASAWNASASEIDKHQMVFFETKVRPLLAEHCWSCHDEKETKGGLRLDTRSAMVAGGDSGESIVPGDPDASLLMEAVRYESYEMPPSGKLSDDNIEILRKWIEIGAPWPGSEHDEPVVRDESNPFTPEDLKWWAIQPVVQRAIPDVDPENGWTRGDLDRFVLAKLQQQSLTPAPEADRVTLIRRLYFDLVGIPPNPSEVAMFLEDKSPDAYERLVDRLLESPAYGERWARHWLDLVRYAESDGYRADGFRPNAWRYRDYVIKSLNEDKPYDRFVREQIAGDELYPGNHEALIATGYLRHGIYEYNIRDALGQWDIIVNEITDTTSDVFLGLGMQCARCHDHKFDPILQSDYFRLRAFFEPLSWRDDLHVATAEEQATYEKQYAAWAEATREIREQIDALEAPYREKARKTAVGRFPLNVQAMFEKPFEERTPFEKQIVELAHRQVIYEYDRLDSFIQGKDRDRLLELRRELLAFNDKQPKPLAAVMAATDIGPVAPPTIIPKKKREVTPGIPALIEAMRLNQDTQVDTSRVSATRLVVTSTDEAESRATSLKDSTGRRSELAKWITDPSNPLSTRVIVNRVWQYHFGRGLAANSSDFGFLGGAPSHPELLDWLTTEFIRNGWRLKPLHRMMVTSATYRQSSTHPAFETQQEIDPANEYYWRFNTRRLDAEQIRDALLAVTGRLDPRRGGPSTLPDQARRSIYSRVMRNDRDPLLDSFDLPLFFSSTASRDTTTSPVQSLMLINSPMMLQRARSLADLASKATGTSLGDFNSSGEVDQRIVQLWNITLGRMPTSDEYQRAAEFLISQHQTLEEERLTSASIDTETSQMPYRDGQSIMVKPDDSGTVYSVAVSPKLSTEDFTFESFFQIRSVYDTGSVRVIAASTSASSSKESWTFGVTGKGSRRKPQTLVMQIFGSPVGHPKVITEAAIFSDQQVELNKPYYVGVSVKLARDGQPGEAVFYLKDLSDDEKPVDIAKVKHDVASLDVVQENGLPARALRIAGRAQDTSGIFDGLIDDVRFSSGVLASDDLLYVREAPTKETIGYWKFDVEPGLLRDSGPNQLGLTSGKAKSNRNDPRSQAFVDLAHVLLNSNSFLYVY